MNSILVVEDEAVVAMDIEARLTKAGYRVCGTADTGEKAIRRALERKPDLVLMDITIKGDIDGIQTAERLRAVLEIPIVYLTAYADGEIVNRAKATDPFGYVIKPFEDRELQVAIEMAFHRHKLTLDLREANERLQREALARSRAEVALRESQERYELAVRGANDGIWDWDLKTNRFYSSPRWKQMLGCGDNQVGIDPADWLDRVHEEDRDSLRVELGAHIEGSREHFECEFRMQHRDGSYRWMLCRGLALRDERGTAYRMAGSQTDITNRKRAEDQLLHDALHDALTGLPNRALFMDRLALALERAKRRADYLFAVLFLDFDGFKAVNDSMGHSQGDLLLIEAARRLRENTRTSDTVARFGGDEFVFLLEELNSSEEAYVIADRVQESLAEPFELLEHGVRMSGSIGIVVASAAEQYERPDDLLRDADIAMYRAKALGRSRNEVFDPELRTAAMTRLRLECDLSSAVAQGQLRIDYQPIFSMEKGTIEGFEALVRWQHPSLGLLQPSEFISVAEETGTINGIGEFVLTEACRQLRRWHETYSTTGQPLFVSVNLSAAQFARGDLPDMVKRVLEETGVPGGCLRLDITEAALMSDATATDDMLARLKSLGVSIDVDDFGQGYSALANLERLPIDTLKIDRHFVRRLDSDTGNADIVRTIILHAHGLCMDVVGEGVETGEQYDRLRALNCEFGQGFFMSKPVDVEAASALLAEQKRQPSAEPAAC